METIKAFIERGNDGTFGVYVDLEDNTLNYGIFGDGKTAQEAIEDFKNSYQEMKLSHEEDNLPFVEAIFEYHYDTASFLSYYSNVLSLAGLHRLTGVNQGQLSQYVNGTRNPSRQTVKRIEKSLHEFGKEISQVNFV